MAGNSHMPRTAKSRADARPRSGRKQAGNGSAQNGVMDDEIGLDALAGHAGYAVRRFQIWIFQDFIRTLSAVDIRPTQYSVMTVIGANPGLSQMAVAKRLGFERAMLAAQVHSYPKHLILRIYRSRLAPPNDCTQWHIACFIPGNLCSLEFCSPWGLTRLKPLPPSSPRTAPRP